MKALNTLGLVAALAMALIAILGAGTASGADLYKYTTPSASDRFGIGTEIVATLETGSSLLIKDTLGGANDTCTSSEIKGTLISDTTTGSNARVSVTTLTFGGCSHTTHVLAKGELEVKWIAGTTNGTVISKGMRITTKSTIFGISCIANTGAGTTIGTITGSKSSSANATIDINGILSKDNGCGDSTWTGSYEVTSPTGLMVEPDL